MMIKNSSAQSKIKQLNYLYCQQLGHQTQPMSRICIDKKCQNKTLVCSICQQQKHKNHQTIPFKKFLLCFYNTSNTNKKNNDNEHFNPLNYAMKIQQQKNSFLASITQFKIDINQILENLQTKAHRYFNQMLQKLLQLFQFQNPIEILTQKQLSIHKIKKYCEKMANQVSFKQKFILNDKVSRLLQKAQSKQKLLINSFSKIKIQVLDMNLKIQKILDISNLNRLQQIQFNWSQQLKGKNIKINGTIAQQVGNQTNGQRFIMLEPSLTAQSEQSKICWGIKISKFAGWIGVGICLRNVIVKANYFFNFSNLGHGSYMISNNGYCWSNSVIDCNSVSKSFPFQLGDTIYLEYDSLNKKLRFRKNNALDKFQLDIVDPPLGDNYYPCANICVSGDSVEVINKGNAFI